MNGVIYCRVSSKEQVEGTSLESQELACREYANRNGIQVQKTFIERGESAKFADRPQLLELLEFCGQRGNAIHALLIWKVDRLARNVGDHFNIKASLLKQGVKVVSVTEPIDTNPEGKLMETILAGFAQFDNDLRATRTLQGMRRKIQEGLFPWKPPFGYKTATQPGNKKTEPDVADQPVFNLLQRAWHEFATGAYTKAELLRFMTASGVRTHQGVALSKQSLDNMLKDPFYAGVIRDPWSGEEHNGKHLPLVSRETFAKVQGIIARRNHSVRHISVRPEFPLRVFGRCAGCRQYLTGGFSRGRSRYYPYYRCNKKGCAVPTSRRVHLMHEEFLGFLHSISPERSTIEQIAGWVRTVARSRYSNASLLRERRAQEVQRLEQQQAHLIQMRMDGLITSEEFKTHKSLLSKRQQELPSVGLTDGLDEREVARLMDEICAPLMNLGRTWQEFPPAPKLRFQRLILPVGFVTGQIGTAQLSCLFSTFRRSENPVSSLVRPEGQSWNQLIRELRELAKVLDMADSGKVAA